MLRCRCLALLVITVLLISGCARVEVDQAAPPTPTHTAPTEETATGEVTSGHESPADGATEDGSEVLAFTVEAAIAPSPAFTPGTATEAPLIGKGDPHADGELIATECRYEHALPLPRTPECYDLVVPQAWDDPATETTVRIHAAVFRSPSASPSPDPVVYLEGGPGGHALDMLPFTFGALVAPYIAERDVVVFDQRGAGRSEPSLACAEAKAADVVNAEHGDTDLVEQQRRIDALKACHDRFVRDGADLAQFNSVASANDVEALRTRLGYEQWNVLGISYGTRLAQTLMRMYPDSIRSVVLDSVVPVEASVLTELPINADRAFNHLFDACSADARCAATYPGLESRFFALVDVMNAEPVEFTATHFISGDETTRRATGDDLIGMAFTALYSQTGFAAVPQLVDELESGDVTVLTAFGSQQATQGDFLSEGMYLSVECHEEAVFESVDLVGVGASDDRLQPLTDEITGAGFFGACEFWGAGEAPSIENESVPSNLPTLLMGGSFDPITPPAGMDAVGEQLSASFAVEFPHDGHAVGVTPCGSEIIAAFFDDPDAAPDTSCVDALPQPAFVPDGPGRLDLVEFEISVTGLNLNGLRPAAWTDAGFAQFVRNRSVVDSAALLFQNTFGTPTAELLNAYGDALDVAEFVPGPPIGERNWVTHSGVSADGTVITVAVLEAGFDGIAIVLISDPEEHDQLRAEVLTPAAAATSMR